jgi:acyl dehydratase
VSAIAVGDELPALAAPAISRTTLALFAGASGDHNPIHIDIDAARAAGMDDVFAHGMLSMAYLGRMLTAWIPQSDLLSWRVRFTAITPVHGEPVCNGTVTGIDETPEGRRATVEVGVTLADGTPTIVGTALVRLP